MEYKNLIIQKEQSIEGISGRIIDLKLTIHPKEQPYQWFRCKVCKKENHYVVIEYNQNSHLLKMDRSLAGGRFDIVHSREFIVESQNGYLTLRILLDKNSLECFINEGEQAASFTLYSPITEDQISFESDRAVLLDIEKYDIEKEA